LAIVIGVRFKRTGKMYYFDPAGLNIREGDSVIVETSRGMEFGDVCMGIREIEDEETVQPLKSVVRIATQEDRDRLVENKAKEAEALVIAEQRAQQHELDMKLVDVEYTFDQKKIIFYFTADGRVDFRELVRDLASRFRVRIELRQIGVRDEAKMLGGLGPCGRPVCCKAFMSDFVPVSIRMAKDQNISLNPVKISGLCGRLMCCLQFEHDHYARTKAELPRIGAAVLTPDGPGEVVEHLILQEAAKVRVVDHEMNTELRSYAVQDMEVISHARREELMAELEQEVKEREERKAAEFAEARARIRSEGGSQNRHHREERREERREDRRPRRRNEAPSAEKLVQETAEQPSANPTREGKSARPHGNRGKNHGPRKPAPENQAAENVQPKQERPARPPKPKKQQPKPQEGAVAAAPAEEKKQGGNASRNHRRRRPRREDKGSSGNGEKV